MRQPDYERDGIRLWCADCLTILPELSGVDCVVTDPPYGIALSNHAAGKERRNRSWRIIGDESAEIGTNVIDWANKKKLPTVAFASPSKPWPGKWRSLLVWHKHGLGMGGDRNVCWKSDWELIQVRNNGLLTGPRESSVLTGFSIRPDQFEFHPCQKPIELLAYLIRKVNYKAILDPFMGSGTTGVACIQTGRHFIGIEKDPTYFATAVKRIDAALDIDRDSLWSARELAEQQRELF